MDRLADPAAQQAAPGLPLTIGFVGSGRAATTLASSLARRGHRVRVAARGEAAVRLAHLHNTEPLAPAGLLAESELLVLAVPDAQVANAARELARAGSGEGLVAVHLAGSLDREVLAPLRRRGYAVAAVHPLQVLSGWRIAPGTTFAVDADPEAAPLVARLVADLSGVELQVPAAARATYHAAAVLAANLGMALLGEAADLLGAAGVARQQALEGLTGLVRGGLEAAAERGLPEALTGPVVRGDIETVARHLEVLRDDPDLDAAYRAVSLLLLRQASRLGRPGPAAAARLATLLREKP